MHVVFEISLDMIAAIEKSVERGLVDARVGESSIAAGSIVSNIY